MSSLSPNPSRRVDGNNSLYFKGVRHNICHKQALLQTPNRYSTQFPGLTLPQAIEANAKLPEPFATLAPKTINMKWLSHLSSILQWASNNGHIDTNPAQGIRVDTGSKVHREASCLPFTKDELNVIFRQPIFADPKVYGLNEWALLPARIGIGDRVRADLAGCDDAEVEGQSETCPAHVRRDLPKRGQ